MLSSTLTVTAPVAVLLAMPSRPGVTGKNVGHRIDSGTVIEQAHLGSSGVDE
jgi:hypothetical protein